MLMLIIGGVPFNDGLPNFNTSHVNVNPTQCKTLSVYLLHFNTSHVNVNRYTLARILLACADFNTSHVNVNLLYNTIVLVRLYNFNTSHVNVNQSVAVALASSNPISIHLMLMLIRFASFARDICVIISIHLMLMLIAKASNEACAPP